jgi:phosphatidylglycerophosphatase A
MTTSAPRPNAKFLWQHPQHLLALGFGSGLMRYAPGTFGTLVGIGLYAACAGQLLWIKLALITFLFLIGIPICGNTGKALGEDDHGSIVWDEIVAIMLVLTFTPLHWLWWLVAFILFRLFDIVKPFPIRQIERKVGGGFGVMLDDLLAAIYVIIIIQILTL